jgi:hypothetical protein
MNEKILIYFQAVAVAWLSCWPFHGHAQDTAYESELNGWRLLQFTQSVEPVLGKPFTTKDDPPLHYRAYVLGDDAYMVFGTHDGQPQVIDSLQLTGTAAGDMLPFKGLKLGDDRGKVIAALGEPTSRTQIDEPKVTRWDYQGTNYSVELDSDDRLYSIRIGIGHGFMEPGDDSDEDWEKFVAAVRSRDPGRLLDRLRPDMEVYRDGEALAIRRRYSDLAASPDAAILDAFFSSTSGVLRYLDTCQAEANARATETMGVGLAYKFNPECPLAEVVLFPYAGEYRVYEVAFRATAHGYAVAARAAYSP